tara:strand:+ start:420 stop:692 length:273 start_codon:yes stop_codon:yes gene_type:complete
MITVTAKELRVLKLVKEDQNEQGHSDFLSSDSKSKSVAGVISSLEKKGLLYNSYENWTRQDFKDMDEKPFKMWCMTDDSCKIVGTPESWD